MLLSKLDTMVEWLQVCAFLNPGLPLIAYPTWESYFLIYVILILHIKRIYFIEFLCGVYEVIQVR